MLKSHRIGARSINFASEPVAVFALGSLSFIGWALFAGPDINWDFLNYHLYAGLNAGGSRLDKDFGLAGGMIYLAPYAHWPIATMIAAKWPAMVVGSVMAAIHSLAIVVTWYLAKQLFRDTSRRARTLRVLSTVLGVTCPLVLTEVGTSWVDITSAIPVVLGVALLIRALAAEKAAARAFVIAGLCFGVATTLKLSGAPYAIAAFLTLTLLWVLRTDVSWKMLVVFVAGEAAGFTISYGVWGYQLWREFGNPIFPFFEFLFEAKSSVSPGAGSSAQTSLMDSLWHFRKSMHQRFLPVGVWDWLLRPLYMLDPVANVYVEVRAPDARFLAFFCIAPFAIWRLRARIRNSSLFALLVFFLIGWVIWMGISGNGRYLMPLALIVGPVLVACAAVVWRRQSVVGAVLIGVFVVAHVAGLWLGTSYRWTVPVWHKYWFSASLPREVTDQPVTLLNLEPQSVSWLGAFMHPDSRLVAFGQSPASEAGSGINRATRLLAEPRKIFVVFGFGAMDVKTGQPFPPTPALMEATAIRNGFKVDFEACLAGKLDESSAVQIVVMVGGERVERTFVHGFFFCPATYQPESQRPLQLNMQHETLLNRIEDACPRLFPRSASTICDGALCFRRYGSTDRVLGIQSDGLVVSIYYRTAENQVLGTVDDLIRDPSRIACHTEFGRYVPWSPGENMFSRGTVPGR